MNFSTFSIGSSGSHNTLRSALLNESFLPAKYLLVPMHRITSRHLIQHHAYIHTRTRTNMYLCEYECINKPHICSTNNHMSPFRSMHDLTTVLNKCFSLNLFSLLRWIIITFLKKTEDLQVKGNDT